MLVEQQGQIFSLLTTMVQQTKPPVVPAFQPPVVPAVQPPVVPTVQPPVVPTVQSPVVQPVPLPNAPQNLLQQQPPQQLSPAVAPRPEHLLC